MKRSSYARGPVRSYTCLYGKLSPAHRTPALDPIEALLLRASGHATVRDYKATIRIRGGTAIYAPAGLAALTNGGERRAKRCSPCARHESDGRCIHRLQVTKRSFIDLDELVKRGGASFTSHYEDRSDRIAQHSRAQRFLSQQASLVLVQPLSARYPVKPCLYRPFSPGIGRHIARIVATALQKRTSTGDRHIDVAAGNIDELALESAGRRYTMLLAFWPRRQRTLYQT